MAEWQTEALRFFSQTFNISTSLFIFLIYYLTQGYDIPVGWTILYSIPSTHLLSPLFAQKTNELIPERWQTKEEHDQYPEEDDNVIFDQELGEKLKSKERFHYIPFGAGHRRCVGKEFALLCMRVFIMEVVRTGKLQLVNGFPEIKTCPFVYPKDNLPLWFEKSRCWGEWANKILSYTILYYIYYFYILFILIWIIFIPKIYIFFATSRMFVGVSDDTCDVLYLT